MYVCIQSFRLYQPCVGVVEPLQRTVVILISVPHTATSVCVCVCVCVCVYVVCCSGEDSNLGVGRHGLDREL